MTSHVGSMQISHARYNALVCDTNGDSTMTYLEDTFRRNGATVKIVDAADREVAALRRYKRYSPASSRSVGTFHAYCALCATLAMVATAVQYGAATDGVRHFRSDNVSGESPTTAPLHCTVSVDCTVRVTFALPVDPPLSGARKEMPAVVASAVVACNAKSTAMSIVVDTLIYDGQGV